MVKCVPPGKKRCRRMANPVVAGVAPRFDFRLVLIPALMVLVIPFYIYVPG